MNQRQNSLQITNLTNNIHEGRLTQTEINAHTYHRMQESQGYRTIVSQTMTNEHKKQFVYHYSEDSQFLIGEGSYGRVYICFYQDERTKKIYKLALKIISIPNTINQAKKIQQLVQSTRQQVKSLLKLRHNPNIIKIEDVIGDIIKQKIYIILQYCNQKNLDHYFSQLHRNGLIMNQQDILKYFIQILNAFKDLYKEKIIHKDIKPENILVHKGVLKIADFGLSKQLFQKRQAFYEEHYGTFVTASPQIRFKQRYTNKCDIYSLGVTLYWMIYQSFPFKNQMNQSQFLKMSLQFENKSQIKISFELVALIKSMLAYSQQNRIQWHELFNHPIFDKVRHHQTLSTQVRETIGRDLNSQYSSVIIDSTIPKEFYRYIMNSSFDFKFASNSFSEEPFIKNFMPIFLQVLNQKYKINFLKELLREVYQFKISDKIKNKMQFIIMKDLIRYGLQKYIVFLMKNLKDQLQGDTICQILDPKMLNQISSLKEFQDFVRKYVIEVQTYEKSNKKPKMNEQQKQTLKKRCQEYQVYEIFEDFIQRKILKQDLFLEQMKKCFVEMIYFIKDEVKMYHSKQKNLAQIQQKRYRSLILLIHHMYMVILMKKIFPPKYSDKIDYDFDKFNQKERYLNRDQFFRLANGINQILDTFQN